MLSVVISGGDTDRAHRPKGQNPAVRAAPVGGLWKLPLLQDVLLPLEVCL